MPYTRLPKKRERPRMGVKDEVRRTFPVHQAFVRRHSCSIPGCARGMIEFHHVLTRGARHGDEYGVSLCGGPDGHHAEFHRLGIQSFQRKYTIDLLAIAEAFCKATTDRALRQMLRERAEENRG
jgi:hypothetical protein